MKYSYLRQFVYGLALLSAAALLLTGCRAGGVASDQASNQTLKMAWSSDAGVVGLARLDPALATDSASQQITSLIFDGLVTLDAQGHIEPWAAASWKVSSDGLTYTFLLRPNLFFSDGVPVRASDYAWSLNRALNACGGSAMASNLAAIKDADAFGSASCANGQQQGKLTTLIGDSILPDDTGNTLTIKLARPAGYFLSAMATPAGFALERSMPDHPSATDWTQLINVLTSGPNNSGEGGSGMFHVISWSSDTANHAVNLVLYPNGRWWGRQFGKIPAFKAVEVTLTDAPYSTLQSDPTVAFASALPESLLSQGASALQSQSNLHAQPIGATTMLIFNWTTTPFDDINARKAFCVAINRDQYNQQVNAGQNMPTWHLVPVGISGYNPNLKGLGGAPTAGDTAQAGQDWQQYLNAHGGFTPNIKMALDSSDPTSQAAFQSLQQMWSRALNVSVQSVSSASGQQATAQISTFGWSLDYADPQDFLSVPFSSGSPWNTQQANVPAADTLLHQADALSNLSQRIPLYNHAEQLLIDNVVACPLFQTVNHYALQPWVKGGFAEDARGLIPNDAWLTGYIAKH